MNGFIRIAHRGSSGTCPENTRAAIEKALESGVDMVEIDCQLSKDGHVVVFHDERLARTARAKGHVRSKTLKELQKLDIGAWFKKSFKGERILTLEEVLDIVDSRADINIDIKGDAQGSLGIELKLLFILSHYDFLERTVFSAFDQRLLRRVRELAPDTRIGILHGRGNKDNPFQLARELGAESLHIQKELATPPVIERSAQIGLKTLVWTVNEVSEMEKFLKLGIAGIFSDYPEKFWKVRQKRPAG
jgi:glycerophosphoryl diester phosphodiesterase